MGANGKRKKTPKLPANFPGPASNGKQPRASVTTSFEDRFPSWQLRSLDTHGPWCWTKIQGRLVQDVLKRLQSFETMRWEEIGGTGSHFISKDKLSREAQKRLEAIKQDDVEEVYSLRLDGKQRIFGIRDQAVLRILWWDPDHVICPSPKKHT